MLVSDSMVIDRPYGEGDVRLIEGARARVGELERMRKVVGMEREKGRLKGMRDEVKTTANGAARDVERKGG